MAENKGILPSSTFNTLGNNSTKWEAVYANKIVGPLTGNVTGNVSGSSGSCTGRASTCGTADTAKACSGNAATATNADKLDGYHYTDIINNAKSSISSGVMGAPNWNGSVGLVSDSGSSNKEFNFTAPSNGFVVASKAYSISSFGLGVNNRNVIVPQANQYDNSNVTVLVKKGDIVRGVCAMAYFVPCS